MLAYHHLDFLSWTGKDVISAPRTETRTVFFVIGAAVIIVLLST
jgi:hypothetical protein